MVSTRETITTRCSLHRVFQILFTSRRHLAFALTRVSVSVHNALACRLQLNLRPNRLAHLCPVPTRDDINSRKVDGRVKRRRVQRRRAPLALVFRTTQAFGVEHARHVHRRKRLRARLNRPETYVGDKTSPNRGSHVIRQSPCAFLGPPRRIDGIINQSKSIQRSKPNASDVRHVRGARTSQRDDDDGDTHRHGRRRRRHHTDATVSSSSHVSSVD